MDSRARVETLDGVVVVELAGELDAFDVPVVREVFGEALERGPGAVALDLAAVSFLDSTVLGAIVGLLRRLRERGDELRVVLPRTQARRIFELTGLESSLEVRRTRADAIAG
jgi:anti-sigma B factor antagonist